MADLYSLIRGVMVQVPDAPEPLVVQNYVDAAREFFETTRIWRSDDVVLFHDSFASNDGTAAFELDAGAENEVIDAVFVEHGGERLEKQTAKQMRYQNGRSGKPKSYRIARGAGRMYVAPGEQARADALMGEFILTPTRGAQSLQDEVADAYGEVIETGTLYRLLRQPHQQWSDKGSAEFFAAEWAAKLQLWRQRAEDDGMRGVVRRVRYGGY